MTLPKVTLCSIRKWGSIDVSKKPGIIFILVVRLTLTIVIMMTKDNMCIRVRSIFVFIIGRTIIMTTYCLRMHMLRWVQFFPNKIDFTITEQISERGGEIEIKR